MINISKRWLDCFCLLYWLIIFLPIVTHGMWTNAISFFHIEKSWTLAITFFFYASSNFFFLKNSILYTLISLIILWIFLKRFFGLRLSVNALIVLIYVFLNFIIFFLILNRVFDSFFLKYVLRWFLDFIINNLFVFNLCYLLFVFNYNILLNDIDLIMCYANFFLLVLAYALIILDMIHILNI